MNGLLLRSAVVAGLSGLLFGFDTAVVSGVTRGLTAHFALSPAMLGNTVASALLGTIIGSLFGGIPGDRWGRSLAMQMLALFYVVSALGSALAWGWIPLIVFRVLGGLAIGGSSVLGPMYIAEISPALWRGRLVGMFQFNIVFGILVAYLSNYFIGQAGLGDAEWRWKLGIAAVPAVLFLVMLFFVPQSPRWLASKGRTKEAEIVLRQIGEPNPSAALQAIVEGVEMEKQSSTHRLFSSKYAFPVFLAISIGVFNQFSGINAIIYYLNDIFQKAGFNQVSSDVQAVVIGLTNLIATVGALAVIDKIGRRALLLAGAIATAACQAGVAFVFYSGKHEDWLVWLLIAFIASFAASQGAVIWVYLSELFPTAVRAKGQSLGSFTHWAMNASISLVYPQVAAVMPAAPFVFFAVMMALQFFVVLFWYPETKGVSLEELQKKMTAQAV